MKKTAWMIIFALVVSLLVPAGAAKAAAGNTGDKVSIAFTSDMHSHLDAVSGSGGAARMCSVIEKIKKNDANTFLLDAGNFSMGTVFQTIYKKRASELKTLGAIGYDAVALGPSEFEYGNRGLAGMLRTAASGKTTTKKTTTRYNQTTFQTETTTTFTRTMPEVVCASINWHRSLADKAKRNSVKALQRAWLRYDVNDYTVIKKDGVHMAVFSLLGDAAQKTARENCGLSFHDQKTRAEDIVKEIQNNGEADMIVCLLPDDGQSDASAKEEACDLAKEVKGIDVMICGSGLTGISKPLTEGSTTIVGAAGSTKQVGELHLQKKDGKYTVDQYKLHKVTAGTAKDASLESSVRGFASEVGSDYLGKYGYAYNETIASSRFSFTPREDLGRTGGDDALGDLISDAYIRAVRKAEGSRYKTVDVAFVSLPNIRASISRGRVTATDAYDINGAGIGVDGSAGYPLVTAYVTGKELKKIAEADASLSAKDNSYRIFVSGMKFSVNRHRLYLNRAFDFALEKPDGTTEKIQGNKLYRIATGIDELRALSGLSKVGFGVMRVEPKNENGHVVKDEKTLVLRHNGRECKTWAALADQLEAMRGGTISSRYAKSQNRILDKTGFNPINFVKGPNYMTVILLAAILIVVVLAVALIITFRRRMYDKRGFGKRVFKTAKKRRSRGYNPKPRGFSLGKRRRRF